MGIINVSAESFYQDSIKTTTKDIALTAKTMERDGANIIDVGAMSTAPYLDTVISAEEEILRMSHAIRIIKKNCNLPISIDTPRAVVAKEAIGLGVEAINDITGLKYDEDMAYVIAESKLPVIVGAYNIRNDKESLQQWAGGTITGTKKLIRESLSIARVAKIKDDNVIVDPCVGFFRSEGKNPFFTVMKEYPWYIRDLEVISGLEQLRTFSNQICVSVSRKSFIGRLLTIKPEDSLIPSIASEIICVRKGAKLIRTHDVKETVQALLISELIN